MNSPPNPPILGGFRTSKSPRIGGFRGPPKAVSVAISYFSSATPLIADVTWEQYEALLETLGEERRVPRINYCNGILELMSPLPAHERPHRIIADIIKTILDAQNRAWEDFGSTTFKRPKKAGLEPDTCFYIHHAEQVRALMRMDMEQDPPPDLAIEADVTSKITLDAYRILRVPEVWLYDSGKLTIQLLQADEYQESVHSLVFPDLPMPDLIPRLVHQAFQQGISTMLRELRQRLQAGGLAQRQA